MTNEEQAMRKNLENAWWGMIEYLVMMTVLPGLVLMSAYVFWHYVDAFTEMRDEYILGPIKAYLDS
jgi:hypothetical protein